MKCQDGHSFRQQARIEPIFGFGEGGGENCPLQSEFCATNTMVHHVMNVPSLRATADPLRMHPGTAEVFAASGSQRRDWILRLRPANG
jgi:hypothetical protein